ncbi:MAG TPA: ATP synthase F1 subunit gamma [bacterium]|nr:ATP synthase F1 subunit gamma [bacterium]
MTTAREVRLRIRSVKNIAQVTRALQAVSASKVRKAMAAVMRTRPYSTKAWQVLTHIAGQPGKAILHPLLTRRSEVGSVLVVLLTGDRGLAGPYNSNIVRFTLARFDNSPVPVRYLTIGRKGRDLMIRRRKEIVAEFSNLPADPSFTDVTAIGRVAVDEFLLGRVDEVYLAYTDFVSMARQVPVIKKLLPLELEEDEERVQAFEVVERHPSAAYIYEPGQVEILDEIIPSFTALQIYQAILESLASEHAARMVAMKNATDSASELASALQLEYNKARQQTITNEMLDIAAGAEALVQ